MPNIPMERKVSHPEPHPSLDTGPGDIDYVSANHVAVLGGPDGLQRC